MKAKTEPIFRGFTEEELTTVFNKIKDPEDWKAPITCKCHHGQVAVVLAAIAFFHADAAEVVGHEPVTGWVIVKGNGYQG